MHQILPHCTYRYSVFIATPICNHVDETHAYKYHVCFSLHLDFIELPLITQNPKFPMLEFSSFGSRRYDVHKTEWERMYDLYFYGYWIDQVIVLTCF